ncbi:hypothetical protein GJ744_001852 [Endocarpon pusillum]|uniref:RNA-directed RNA polymerase n=1 Tax=Endocarpon pusillum TaxID=364733 RepID=A0A8H7ARN0_9EURO|nr:hypothetical protein GJ744_001852 [Endocarpon pusillum]
MAISNEGGPKQVRGRMAYGSTSRRRRLSKARSSTSGASWDQSLLPLSLRGTSFNTTTRIPTAAKVRDHQKVRMNRPHLPPGSSRVILALNPSSEQVRPFDAFVNVPSPFAKQKEVAKDQGQPSTPELDIETPFTTTTKTLKTLPSFHYTSTPRSPPEHTFVHETDLTPDTTMYSNRRAEGYLDAKTRAVNLQHTKPEWTTWDFLDLFISNLPSGIKTVDLWRNFKREGEVDLIDIFVTRGGQKDTKARLRFRPPPRRDFFTSSSKYTLNFEGGRTWPIQVQLDRDQRKTFTTTSPVNENVTYPDTTELGAESIDFGVLVAPDTMLIKRTRHSTPRGAVSMVLNLGRREIGIRFPSVYADKTREYKFTIPIDQVFDLSQFQEPGDTKTSFILTLRTPPHFYKKLSGGISATHDDAAFTWREDDAWLRQTNVFSSEQEVALLKACAVTLKNHPEGVVNIGRWTTYRITVDDKSVDKEKYRVFRAALRDYNVPIARVEKFLIAERGEPAWDLLDASLTEHDPTSISSAAQVAFEHSLHSLLNPKMNEIYLPFPVRYQLDVCISNGWINEHNITREFLDTLSKTDHERSKHLLECVALNNLRIFDPMDMFKLRVRRLPSMRSRIPENCVLIRSVIITPSTMILTTPYIEMTNRVIRRYKEHADRFLRVRFEDDQFRGYARISATSQKTMDEVLSKVFRTLTRGIVIGDRHYEFLAFGNSQLREHGAYFFASLPSGPTASHIRAWMGRFHHERIVAKHAARIGQCFSTTRAIRTAGFPPVRQSDLIDDVERNGFNFTDGVGKISRFYAETIAKELGIRGTPPSVYQFRMAGCKGVLAIAPELGSTNVKIRQSQFKFETTYSGMEIIRWSEYWVATLNRQLVLVLSSLGVPDDIFLLIQDKEIQLMERAMVNDSAAMEALTGHVDPNRMTLTIASLVQAGFRRTNEPFVTSLLGLWRAWSIKYLKEKAKLPVREGACILGCTDETGTLRGHFDADRVLEGEAPESRVAKLPEVFVQITSPDSGHRRVIEGLCVIARNPSLHPGDMRVVKAIDVPALHHLVDVLVMPQTGDRDISSMCSGGDLDGDDYVVIWDERLLPKIWNAEPMDYTPPPPKPLERDVTQTDITRFFVKYMKNDFLPKIALSHLAWADFLDEGIRDKKCLELARLHSKAVDYPKSGQPAQMPKALNAKQWPHFMEKKGRNTYKSHKILGQLYDAVDRVAFLPNYDAPFDMRILDAAEPSDNIMQDARELKQEYDTSLQRIMAQHDIKSEFEVWSTFVLDHSKASKDYKFHEEIGQLSSSLKQQYYNAVIEKAGGKSWSNLVPWAVAMYRVTKEELEAARLQGTGATMPFISFPWLLRSTLIEIAKGVDSLATKKPDCGGRDLLDNIREPTFDSETQIYDDPYQPGTDIPEEVILSDPLKEELSVAKEKAPSHDLDVTDSNQNSDMASTAQIDAHHIDNEGFPPGSYVPGLGIPPQPTPEQFHWIEEIINHPGSLDVLPKTISNFFSASGKPASRDHAVGKHEDKFAHRSRTDPSLSLLQHNSIMPSSLLVSDASSSQNTQESMNEATPVRELSEIFKGLKMVKSTQQNSSSETDAHGMETIGKETVFTDPFATAGGKRDTAAKIGLQATDAWNRSLFDDDSHDAAGGESTSDEAVLMDPLASTGGDPGTSGTPYHGDKRASSHSLLDDGLHEAQDEDDGDGDETILMDPLASGGSENEADRLLKLGGL